MEHTAVTVLEVGAILLAAAFAGWVARRLTLPAILGYLVVGVAVSRFTPGYVADPEQVNLFAEVGAILLLFEVGIEVDLGELRREHPAVLWAAPLQIIVTMVAAIAGFVAFGLDLSAAALLGLAIAMSSSVVVVNITRSRRRTTDAETEHLLVGWAVLQDVVGVAIAILLLTMLGAGQPFHLTILGIIAFGALALASARFLPYALAGLRNQPDLFLTVSVATGLAVAGAGALFTGIPLALAAFIAGLSITEGPVSAEARRRLVPFRDLFAIFFFVAIGTLIDPAALLSQGLGWLALSLALVVVAKSGVIFVLARVSKLPAHPEQLAVGLGQIGEFGFVLATVAVARGVLPPEVYAALLAAVAISIAVSSILVRYVKRGAGGPAVASADA
ncbi:MAG TPA: cation:proton antiporter [Candidatus Limnocylindrales bacterium]|nr:cation:proton antiporter [Candidatus Limnocylindrales bacterium]